MVVALNLCATIETCSPNMKNYFVEAWGSMEFSLIAHFWEWPAPPWLLMGGKGSYVTFISNTFPIKGIVNCSEDLV